MLPYSEVWRWDIHHIEVCSVERYVDSYLVSFIVCGRWKCWDVALHAGGRLRMWIAVCVLMNLGAWLGEIIIIPINTAVGVEVIIHTLGAISVGMVALLVFLIYSEHLFSIPALFFVYIAAIHVGGWASGWRGVLILQNCPLACWYILNCCSEIFTAFVSS